MKLSFIRYGKRKVKVHYVILQDCLGLYDPNLHILQLDKRLKDLKLFNTLMHELFHIIMNMEDIDVNEKGEEPIAIAVGNGFEKIFMANPFLVKLLTKCLKKNK
jgi:hypothetical protein|tara:strand:- start:291 stop:602 length:312 start_codon:yes stop_codon:yes gene_type:complete